MHKTGFCLRVAFTFVLLSSMALRANTRAEAHSIVWKPVQTLTTPDGKKQQFLYFDGAQYPKMPENPLPWFNEIFDLNSASLLNASASLLNPIFAPLTPEENELILSMDAGFLAEVGATITMLTKVAEIKKQHFAYICFIPLRKNEASGSYEKLVSFSLSLQTLPPDNSMIRNGNNNAAAWAASSVLATGKWHRIGVTQDGIYRLSYSFLSSLGVNLTSLDPSNIRLYGNGGGQVPYANNAFRRDDLVENAIRVQDNGTPGLFDSSDYVLFYGMSPNRWKFDTTSCARFVHNIHKYCDTTYYFITVDLGAGKRITVRPSSVLVPTDTVTTFDDYYFHENDDINLIKSGREWYGEYFDITNSYTYPFSFPNIDLSSPAYVKVEVMGRSHQINGIFNVSSGPCSYQLSCNGTDVTYYASPFAWAGTGCCNYLPASSNLLVTVTKVTPSPAVGWLNYIEVTARRQLLFNTNQMGFRDSKTFGPGNITQFHLGSANASTIVWDVTDPTNVAQQGGTLNGSQFEFRVNNDSLLEFCSFNGLSYLTPTAFGEVANQNLHATPQVDMLIVTYPGFYNDAVKLGDLHLTRDGITYAVATTTQIYNEFSSGAQDVSAIRDFMRMLYERAGSVAADLPRYLLLYGDGSYDNKRRITNNTNFVPTYQSINSFDPVRSYVSDDFFVLLGANEGDWDPGDPDKPDAGVGRLPVTSSGGANDTYKKVEKYSSVPNTVNYQSSPSCQEQNCSVFGEWRNMLTFVGDDEDGNTHVSQTENITAFMDTAYDDFNINKIYLDAYQQVSTPGGDRYPGAVDAINRSLERGCLIWNYIGHGGEVGLAHERVVEVNQINNWNNFCNMPLFFTATCEFSRWDDPGRISAGEYVFLNADGGGIGLFTTVRLVFSGPNFTLNRNFYNYAFDTLSGGGGVMPRLGDLNMLTKSTLLFPDDNHRNFTLLCDPAIMLSYPKHDVVALTINTIPVNPGSPDTLSALQKVTVTGEVRNSSGIKITNFNGIVYPLVLDKPSLITCLGNDPGSLPVYKFYLQKNILYRGKASVVNGDFTFSFIIPKDIAYQYGKGRVSFYAHNGMEDASGYNEDFYIGGSDTNAPLDTEGPQVSLFMNDANFVEGGITDENPDIYVVVFDTNGINTVGTGIGHDLVAVMDNNSANPFVLNDYYESDLNSYSRGSVRYPLEDLEPGTHTMSVKVWDVYNNSSMDYTEFLVAESAVLALDHVLNYPNPFTTKTEFFFEHNKPCDQLDVQIQVFTVSGKLIKTINTDVQCEGYRSAGILWDGLDDYGDKVGRGVYFYRLKVRSPEGDMADEYSKLVILK